MYDSDDSDDYDDYDENTSGYNALFYDVHNGEVDLVRPFLKKNSIQQTIHGRTLIHVAAARGHEEIVKLLLTKRDNDGNTPLHLAVKANHAGVFNLLLEELNVNAKNLKGERPLHIAAKYNRIEFTKILIENGAIVNVKNNEGRTPLTFAFKERNLELAGILCKSGATLNDYDFNNVYPLQQAAEGGNLELVKLLMETEYINNVNIINLKGGPFFSAVSSGHLEVVKYFMEIGTKNESIIYTDVSDELIINVIKIDRLDILKYLFDAGVKIKENLIYHSIFRNRLNFWKYLIKCRSKYDLNAHSSETKLHHSLRAGNVEIVKEILSEKIEIESNSQSSKLAVYIAVETGNEEILRILLKAGFSVESFYKDTSPLHTAATFQHTRLVEMLLEAGAEVNSQTKDGYTPLHFAALAEQITVIRYLLKNGADYLKSGRYHETPLFLALDMISTNQKNHIVIPSKFENLITITKLLFPGMKRADIPDLLARIISLRVSNEIEEKNSWSFLEGYSTEEEDESESQESSENGVFRPEIIKYLFSHLTDWEIKYYTESVINGDLEHYTVDHTPELLYTVIEYNDGKSCFNTKLRSWNRNYECNLLLTSYIKNVENLINTENEPAFVNQRENRTLYKLIATRLVLLTNNSHSKMLEFCEKHKLDDWRKECESQKIRMQQTKIADGFNVTFYDILTKPIGELSKYLRNENFLQVLEASGVKFPAYTDFLKVNVERGKRKKDLIENSTNCLYNLIKRNHKIQIPNVAIDKIFNYLSVIDLRKFLVICSSESSLIQN